MTASSLSRRSDAAFRRRLVKVGCPRRPPAPPRSSSTRPSSKVCSLAPTKSTKSSTRFRICRRYELCTCFPKTLDVLELSPNSKRGKRKKTNIRFVGLKINLNKMSLHFKTTPLDTTRRRSTRRRFSPLLKGAKVSLVSKWRKWRSDPATR